MSSSEVIYREGYTEGYQQAIKDVTVYKISKIQAKKFSINELSKWKNFEDEFNDDFSNPPKAISQFPEEKKPTLKFIYIIKMKKKSISFEEELRYKEGNFYKIGITGNLKNRLITLQTSSPVPLEVFFKYRTLYAESIEVELHKYFERYNTSGEWFILDENHMRDFLNNKFPVIVRSVEKKLATPPTTNLL